VVRSLRSHIPIVVILTYHFPSHEFSCQNYFNVAELFNGQLAGRIVKRVTGIPDSQSESRISKSQLESSLNAST
jgi:hypothetical protein